MAAFTMWSCSDTMLAIPGFSLTRNPRRAMRIARVASSCNASTSGPFPTPSADGVVDDEMCLYLLQRKIFGRTLPSQMRYYRG